MGDKLKPLLFGLGIVVVLGGAYFWYIRQAPDNDAAVVVVSDGEPPTVPTSAAPENAEVAAVLQAIAIVRDIRLDTKFFEDPRFRALRATPIVIPPLKKEDVPKRPFSIVAPPSSPSAGTRR